MTEKRALGLWREFRIVFAVMVILLSGCTDKPIFSDNPQYLLSFSCDTLAFDTVFTSEGSAVELFVIYNNNSDALRLDVSVAGGADSPFRINVDGQGGSLVRDVEIRARDSVYCFVTVNIDPQDENNPVLVEDSVRFVLQSGVRQFVNLTAYGQDVIRMRGMVLPEWSETTLTSDRPYLVYDSLFVGRNAVLNIQKGTRIYFHNDAFLRVAGRLLADGTCDSMIVMRGDRLDRMLDDLPYDLLDGRWGGIRFDSCSFSNRLAGCDIHGGSWGIATDTSSVNKEKMLIDGCIIHNVQGDALELNFCSSRVRNSQITNSGGHCVDILGGDNSFLFCTIANFYPWSSKESALYICNVADSIVVPLINADFKNCIITGYDRDELMGLVMDSITGVDPSLFANYSITNSLVLTLDTANTHLRDNVWDFDCNKVYGAGNFRHVTDDFRYDFRLDSLSMARGMAADSKLCPTDITGVPRPVSGADVGCYQYVPY